MIDAMTRGGTRGRAALLLLLSSACAAGAGCDSATAPRMPIGAAPADAGVISRVERGLSPPVRVTGEDIGWTIEARMREHHVLGLSIAVIDGDRIAWTKTYGVADAETRAPVTDATLFQAGSISKTVNAMAVLLAATRAGWSLDQPVNELLKSWQLPENEFTHAAPVTLRRLLSHTAGTTVHGFQGYAEGDELPSLIDVLDGRGAANSEPVRVDGVPGKQYRYSGGGTSITQFLLVEQLRQTYPTIIHDSVLAPLGMAQSTFDQPLARSA